MKGSTMGSGSTAAIDGRTSRWLCSTRFRRAVVAERERLIGQFDKAWADARKRRSELATAEQREGDLRARIALLSALLGGETPSGDDGRSSPGTRDCLEGRCIREVAVRVLLESGSGDSPIHYRRWLSLVEAAGYQIAGRRADAVFLNQVVRSPVVKATTTRGFYQIEFDAPERLREEVDRLRGSLTTAAAEDVADSRENESATKTRELLLSLGRVQRRLDEALDALAAAAPREGERPPVLAAAISSTPRLAVMSTTAGSPKPPAKGVAAAGGRPATWTSTPRSRGS
jgi:hypothetical protein